VPIALVALLAAGRLVGPRTAAESAAAASLYERASRAYTEQRYGDAAEYVRSALVLGAPPELKPELLCVRGESLLRADRPREAAEAFETVTRDFPGSPHEAQALFGAVQAREAAGEAEAAAPMRKRLLAEFGDTPWASRLAGRAP
jgi:outer membrane protein assembly factor BamD (BamD/ComL family)